MAHHHHLPAVYDHTPTLDRLSSNSADTNPHGQQRSIKPGRYCMIRLPTYLQVPM